MNLITTNLKHMLSDESGQDLIEYALIASLVGLVAVASLRGLNAAIATAFSNISTALTSAS